MKPAVTIIVLTRDRWADARRCLLSVKRHTDPAAYELLVYDNASTDATPSGLRRLAGDWPALRVVRNERNVPFAAAVNRGMREGRGRFFVWLNNDTVVGPGWLEALIRAAESSRDAAAAGPMTDHLAPPAQLSRPFESRRSSRVEETPFLGGFCFLVKRAAVERAGLLDEKFVWGWEDMDYCLRLRHAGFKLLLSRDVFVRHLGSRTMKTMPSARRRRTDLDNRARLARKWIHVDPWRGDAGDLLAACPAPWAEPAPDVSVALVCRGPWEVSGRCLDALRASLGKRRVEVIALCLDADRRTVEGTAALTAGWPALRSLGACRGLPYAHAVNLALKRARAPRLVVLADDVLARPGWLDGLLAVAESDRAAGVVSAAWPDPSRPALPSGPGVPYAREGCLLIPRDAFASLGDFDDRFRDKLGAEDYCLRARQRGFHVLEAGRVRLRRLRPRGASRAGDNKLLFDKWFGHHLFQLAIK